MEHNLAIIACKKCGASDTVKCGYIREKQRFRCKKCGYTFVIGDERTTEQIAVKKAMLLILHIIAGATCHELGRLFNLCPSQVSRWIMKSGFPYPTQDMYGKISQVSVNELDSVLQRNIEIFDQSKPMIFGAGELMPGYRAIVMIQTPGGNKVKDKDNPFHEYRTLPYTHR